MTSPPPPAAPPAPPKSGGIFSQIKKLNDRLDEIEESLTALQGVIDDEVLPAVKIAVAKSEAALEEASNAIVKVSKNVDRPRPKPKKSRSR